MRLAYKTYAESAVKAEKKGHYLEAAKNWADAKRNTAVKKNIEYCQHRIDFLPKTSLSIEINGTGVNQ